MKNTSTPVPGVRRWRRDISRHTTEGLRPYDTATLLVPSISITSTTASESVIALAVIAFVFTLVNSIIKPVVKTLAFPLYLLMFGLFALVTDSLLFALTGWLSTSLGIPMTTGGFLSCLAGAVITSVVTSVVSGVLRDKKADRD